jgi:hypothetical protein
MPCPTSIPREVSALVDRSHADISSCLSPSSPTACELAPHGGLGGCPSKVTRRHHNLVRRPFGLPFLLCQTRHPNPNLLFVLRPDLIAGCRGAGLQGARESTAIQQGVAAQIQRGALPEVRRTAGPRRRRPHGLGRPRARWLPCVLEPRDCGGCHGSRRTRGRRGRR